MPGRAGRPGWRRARRAALGRGGREARREDELSGDGEVERLGAVDPRGVVGEAAGGVGVGVGHPHLAGDVDRRPTRTSGRRRPRSPPWSARRARPGWWRRTGPAPSRRERSGGRPLPGGRRARSRSREPRRRARGRRRSPGRRSGRMPWTAPARRRHPSTPSCRQHLPGDRGSAPGRRAPAAARGSGWRALRGGGAGRAVGPPEVATADGGEQEEGDQGEGEGAAACRRRAACRGGPCAVGAPQSSSGRTMLRTQETKVMTTAPSTASQKKSSMVKSRLSQLADPLGDLQHEGVHDEGEQAQGQR